MKATPFISVVIPFHRGERGVEPLLACVRSCLAQTLKPGDLEVLVVSNLEDPKLEEELRNFDRKIVRGLTAGSLGVNKARNTGARQSAGKWIYFLDDDCRLPHPQFLSERKRELQNGDGQALWGGPYLSRAEAPWRERGYNHLCSLWVERTAGESGSDFLPVAHLLGGNLCLPRAAVAQGLRFDERVVAGGDENSLCREARKAGYELRYAARWAVEHRPLASWRGIARRAWKQGAALGQLPAQDRPTRKGAWPRGEASRLWFLAYASLHLPIVYFAAILQRILPRAF